MPLMQAGLTSKAAVLLAARLRATTGVELPATLVFEYATPRAIASHLDTVGAAEEVTQEDAVMRIIDEELNQRTRGPQHAVLARVWPDVAAGVPADLRLPCSSLQHQLLLHQQLEPDSSCLLYTSPSPRDS